MGLVIFAAIGLYLLISIGVVAWAIRYARKSGKSAKRWGWGALLVMYLIPFWDWIPTVAVHQYYCAKDSGFWVYKTLDQWKVENPGVMETLLLSRGSPSSLAGESDKYTVTVFWNHRFNLSLKKDSLLVNGWRWEHEIVDGKTGEVLAKRVDFSTGNGHIGGEPELRFWLHSDGCSGRSAQASLFNQFANQFRGAEK